MANSTYGTRTIYLLAFVGRDGREAGLHRTRRMPDGKVIDNSSRHYLGITGDLDERLKRHRTGRSRVAIINAALKRGLYLKLVRIWVVPAERALRVERSLKRTQHAGHFCPDCLTEREEAYIAMLSDLLSAAPQRRRRFIKRSITLARRRLEQARALLREARAMEYLCSGLPNRNAQQIAAEKIAAIRAM